MNPSQQTATLAFLGFVPGVAGIVEPDGTVRVVSLEALERECDYLENLQRQRGRTRTIRNGAVETPSTKRDTEPQTARRIVGTQARPAVLNHEVSQ